MAPSWFALEGAGSRGPSFLFVFEGHGGTLVPSLYVLGGRGKEHSYYPVVTQSLTSWGRRGYPHLRTAVEGLEEGDLQCQVDSGKRIFHQAGLLESLEGK